MHPQNIFLASSSELLKDREQFELFIGRRNKSCGKKGLALELVNWEDFIDAVSKTRLQDEYNKAIRDCFLFVMLIDTKVGKYSEEEFDTAYECFKLTGKPLIYTYFKDAPISTGTAHASLSAFQEKLKNLGHFPTACKNTEDFLLKFGRQLDKLADSGYFQLQAQNQAATETLAISKIPKLLTAPPFIPDIFQGRDGELQAVHQKLLAGDSLLLLVNGEGGIGKTTLAAKYWQLYGSFYQHSAWLFAQKNLLDALLTLALPLQMDFPAAMPALERFQAMLAAMASLDAPCLLIIDNANDMRELEQHYLSLRSCPNFHILLTTRITRFGQAETYRIEPLKEADALALFKTHYPKHQDDEDDLLKSIRTAVGGNTLVMELLAKNLAAINADEIFYSLADLLHDLQKRGLLRLSQTENVTVAEKGHHPALKKANPTDIIAALYDEMEMVVPLTEAEQRLLCNLAVLPAENVAYDLLKTLLAPPDAKAFSGTLTDLAQRGWLEKSLLKNASCYKISPVVQEITRHKNKENLPAYCETVINTLIEKLAYQPGIGHFLNASYQEAALYSRYAVAVTSCFQETDFNLSLLCDCIGNYHQTTGNLDQALGFYKEAHRLENELYDAYPDNVDFKNSWAIACARVGTIHAALGHLDQAWGFYKEYQRLAKELYDAYPDNVDFKNGLAVSCQYLGITHTALGNLDQALGFYKEFHRLVNELHDAYPDNVFVKNGLAIACQRVGTTHIALGNLDQALGLYQEYQRLEKELYDAYPDYVDFKNNWAIACEKLGIAHAALGNLEQALGLYQEYHRLENELYDAYPDNVQFKNLLAIACQYLGITHTALGNRDQALGFYKEYHRLKKELYDAYPDNVDFKNGLALSCQHLGWFFEQVENKAKASEYYRQSQALLEQLVGSSPLNVKFKSNLDWVVDRLAGK